MRTTGLATAAAVLLLVSACGGAARPSADDVARGLMKARNSSLLGNVGASMDAEQAGCFARAMVASKLSDQALVAMARVDRGYRASTADAKAMSAIAAKIARCAGPTIPDEPAQD